MKALQMLVLGAILSVVLIGTGTRTALGQAQKSGAAAAKAAGYPSDIHPETWSRITMPKRDALQNDEERELWDKRIKDDPEVFTPFHGTAHRLHLPVVSYHTRETLLWLRANGPLEDRLKVLVQLVAARETDNQIEYQAKPKGLTPEIIDIVKNKKEPTGLPEKEQVIIHFIREMIRGPKVSSKTYTDAQRLFGERGVLSMVSFTTYYAANALLFRAYDTRLPPDEPAKF